VGREIDETDAQMCVTAMVILLMQQYGHGIGSWVYLLLIAISTDDGGSGAASTSLARFLAVSVLSATHEHVSDPQTGIRACSHICIIIQIAFPAADAPSLFAEIIQLSTI
jgi:hypothetical protein